MSSRVAGICFDVLRVRSGARGSDLYRDVLGDLQRKLRRHVEENGRALPGFGLFCGFLDDLEQAKTTRNDLIHALPVRDGLLRVDGRKRVEFYTIESLVAAQGTLQRAWVSGTEVLHFDDGSFVRDWYARSGS